MRTTVLSILACAALFAGEAPKPPPKPGGAAAKPAVKPGDAAKPAEPAVSEAPKPPPVDPALVQLMVAAGADPAKASTLVSGFTARRVMLGRVTGEQWERLCGKEHEVWAGKPFTVTYQFRKGVGLLIMPDPTATWSSGPGKPAVDCHGSDSETLDEHARMALLVSGNDSAFEPVEGVPLQADDGDIKLVLKANDDTPADNTGSVRVKFIWVKE